MVPDLVLCRRQRKRNHRTFHAAQSTLETESLLNSATVHTSAPRTRTYHEALPPEHPFYTRHLYRPQSQAPSKSPLWAEFSVLDSYRRDCESLPLLAEHTQPWRTL